jgi:hypothetical protein
VIERTFKEIPEGKIEESDTWPFLASLGYSSGKTWADLLKSKRILIVSEAGSGKTYECENQSKLLWGAGEPAFRLELATLATSELRTMLQVDQEMRFDQWLRSQSEVATFFLDSYDELKLSLGSFELALNRLAKSIYGKLDRARIVITTRPIPFDEELVRRLLPVPKAVITVEPTGENFARIALHGATKEESNGGNEEKNPDWTTLALLPLSDEQIVEFVSLQGVENPDEMFADLKRRNALEFARRPQDLIELSADWKDHKRIRTHREQVESNILTKLKPRVDRPEPAELSVAKAMEGAKRLALAMMVTRRLTIRHSAESDHGGTEATFDPGLILKNWTADKEIKALLERPLFGFASYGRVRFHHRSVLEYLAAARLSDLRSEGMTSSALKRLIFTETRGKIIVRHSKRAIAGWLALSVSTIFEALRDNEPEVLLNEGDPESLSASQRYQALRAYVERHGKGGWRGRKVPGIQIHRFASADLSGEIKRLWSNGVENPEIRELLLELIELGSITECSDIAYTCASNPMAERGERLAGLDALAAIKDERLSDLVDKIAAGSSEWTGKVSEIALMRLFPKHLGIYQMFQMLPRLKHEKGRIGDLNWFLPTTISQHAWNPGELESIRDGFAKLISEKLRWQEQWPNYASSNEHLASLLAVTCIRGLEGKISSEWLRAAVMAILLADYGNQEDKEFSKLLDILNGLPPESSREIYWATDAILQSLHPLEDPFERYAATTLHWKIRLQGNRDADWISGDIAETSRNESERAMLLEAALRLGFGDDSRIDYMRGLKNQVADLPELVGKIDEWLISLTTKSEPEEWEIKQAKWKEDAARKEACDLKSWNDFWSRLSQDPECAFSQERETHTVWNLWHAMTKAGSRGRDSGWNRQFVMDFLGSEMADRLRQVLMRLWRSDSPTLASERPKDERGTYLVRWQLGLAGIYAEAEDPNWAQRLSKDEACLASRYATIELNSLPSWMDALVIAHPCAVEETLGMELIAELNETDRNLFHSMLLQNLGHSGQAVRVLFIPRLREWLEEKSTEVTNGTQTNGEIDQVAQVTGFLAKYGSREMEAYLAGIAGKHLARNPAMPCAKVWLSILLQFDAEAGIDALEQFTQAVTPSSRSDAVNLIGWLFGERGGGARISCQHFTPMQLLRLMRLVYTHVRTGDDVHHKGAYTPDARDNAEQARNNIVNAILTSKGEEGWSAKMEMSRDPLCAHFKDRILAMAEESWAEEIDGAAFNDQQAVALDQSGEAPPATNEAMFELMVNRLEEIDDILLQDTSPRAIWAKITHEPDMRRAIARELSLLAKGIYKIDQEAVTADEKETDIRLRSTVSEHEAIIELKLADDRSANDLLGALEEQLVTKYMASENSRSGCLLITLSKDRTWDHPNGGQRIDFSELIALLRIEADKIIEKYGHSIRLHLHAFDLRPRLQTEKNSRKSSARS